MKIGVVGSGLVGSTAAYALVMRGVGREIVLVDVNRARAEAEADDIYHAVPFAHPLDINDGDYADLAGCKLVIIAAGANQKPGETRLQLLSRNAAIFSQVIPQILQHAPDAVLIVATNPVDIMTHLSAHYAQRAGVMPGRVIGSGTTLDTARFRSLLGRQVGVDSQHIHGYVIGEHGDSEVLTWSLATVAGLPLKEFCDRRGITMNQEVRDQIDQKVRNAAYHIISGKGATYYGIGSALARIADVILHDQRSILTICTPIADVAGVKHVTIALPHLVGGGGSLGAFDLPLNESEQIKLHKSAALIRDVIDALATEIGETLL